MLPFLDLTTDFPDVNNALEEPNGLLAAGADLSPSRLINAYTSGIFPWFSEDEPILWWSPNPRTIIEISRFQPSKSLIRASKNHQIKVTLNHDFDAVIRECAAPRINQPGTWITEDIIEAYCQLNRLGLAHSVEVWDSNNLIGGIYGVAIGRLFCGESMFSRKTNGSKIALSALIGYLKLHSFPILDCQVNNQHLVSLGAIEITRKEYLSRISELVISNPAPEIWQPRILNHSMLIVRTRKA